MLGSGIPSHLELALAAASGHRRGRSEGLLTQFDEKDPYHTDDIPPTMDIVGLRGMSLSNRQTEPAWSNSGAVQSNKNYLHASDRSIPLESQQIVQAIQKRSAFSGAVDTMMNVTELINIYCDGCGDDAEMFEENTSSIGESLSSTESGTIDDTTLPSTILSGSDAPRDWKGSSIIERGPIYRDFFDTMSDLNGSMRLNMEEGRDDVPSVGTRFSNPHRQSLVPAHWKYLKEAVSSEKKTSFAVVPRLQFSPTSLPQEMLSEVKPKEEPIKGKVNSKTKTKKVIKIRSRSMQRNKSSGKQHQSITSETIRTQTKGEVGKEAAVSFRSPRSMRRARSISGRNRRSIETQDMPMNTGNVVKSPKDRKSLKCATPQIEVLPKSSAYATRGRSRSRNDAPKCESSRSASRRRVRSKSRTASNRFSGRAMIDRLRGRSPSCRGRSDIAKTSEKDAQTSKNSKKVQPINQSIAPSECQPRTPVSCELEGIDVPKEEFVLSNMLEQEGKVTGPSLQANSSKMESKEDFVIGLLKIDDHDKKDNPNERNVEKVIVLEPLASAMGAKLNRKTMLGRQHAKSLKRAGKKIESEETKEDLVLSYPSKASQAPIVTTPRNYFSWRKSNPKAAAGNIVPSVPEFEDDSSVDIPANAENRRKGIIFPVPNDEGQEIALNDDDHCYDDPANVHSMLTMPSFSSTTNQVVKAKVLRSSLKNVVPSAKENQDDRVNDNKIDEETIATDLATVKSQIIGGEA
jgi:hypothetical protein